MALEPLDLKPWVTRLNSQLTGVHEIGLALDIAGLDDQRVPTPSVWLLAVDDRGQDISGSDQRKFINSSTVSVCLFVNAANSPRGDAATDPVRALRAQVWQALIGWQPLGSKARAVTFNRGRLISFDRQNGIATWLDLFTLPWRVTP